ncbi:MAG: hypothetical protein KAX18_05270 [Candidatus Lokiarchaeota archaeon]|nr:hypothetical protein [Candidatus Lokiarchaeota archaeon]
MKVQRLKSIDVFRGLCMFWIVLTHLIDWWLKSEFVWLHRITVMLFDSFGASGLLFISGVSIALSYRNKMNKINTNEDYSLQTVRNSYLMRAFFFFILALFYNIFIAISLMDPKWIWTWFVLLTASISLIIAWPLLKTSKLFRIILGCAFWIVNPFFVNLLLPYEGTWSLYGILFHIFYSGIYLVPILVFFPFFLFGTVIGDVLYDTFQSDYSQENERKSFGFYYLIPSVVIGTLLIIFGVLYEFPRYLLRESLSWVIYSLGINIVLISLLLSVEVYELIKTSKSYKLFFYFSYYSLTIFLTHNILHFLFLNQLNLIDIWFLAAGVFILMSLGLRLAYKLWQGHASVKVQIGRISSHVVMKLEERSNKKLSKSVVNSSK